MSRFRLASPSASSVSSRPTTSLHKSCSNGSYNSSDSEDDDLPYPTELARTAFLAPDFDASTYLSTLRNRHQTLEDLRSELRERSQLLSRELLELVNGHYEAFLSLGGDLRGGEEKVESVRVGVLGFEREVKGLAEKVGEREVEVEGLVRKREELRTEVVFGRKLLEVETKIGELEDSMGVGAEGREEEIEEDEGDEEEDDVEGDGDPEEVSIRKLQRHVREYVLVDRTIDRIGSDHPFLVSLRPRRETVKKTLLLDLTSSLRQARSTKANGSILSIIRLYSDLQAESESLKVLKAP